MRGADTDSLIRDFSHAFIVITSLERLEWMDGWVKSTFARGNSGRRELEDRLAKQRSVIDK